MKTLVGRGRRFGSRGRIAGRMTAASKDPARRHAGPKPADPPAKPGREKVSVTIERATLEEIRRRADNLSEYVNDALQRELYRQRIQEEIERLDAEGVVPDPRAIEWWRQKILETRRRRARRRAPEGLG
ncbi:MAG: hypothetical protein ACRDGT_09810 [Candidatus Limnocylindria bacterium]